MMNQSYLKQHLNYDPATGVFTWIRPTGRNVKVGYIAGSQHVSGYRIILWRKKNYLMHRLAWLYVHGHFPEGDLDHINGDKGDNRISNLRVATRSQNNFNRGKLGNNTSGIKGVFWHVREKKWYASIQANKKRIHLGCFDDLELASLVYSEAAWKYHGIFARIA